MTTSLISAAESRPKLWKCLEIIEDPERLTRWTIGQALHACGLQPPVDSEDPTYTPSGWLAAVILDLWNGAQLPCASLYMPDASSFTQIYQRIYQWPSPVASTP